MHQLLHRIPPLSRLSPPDLAALARLATRQVLLGNTLFLHEGSRLDALHVVRRGQVKLVQGDEEGRAVVLSVLGPGEYFGVEGLFGRAPRTAAAMTIGTTELLVLARDVFLAYLAHRPDVVRHLCPDRPPATWQQLSERHTV